MKKKKIREDVFFDVVVVGAGGTGSYFLKEFSRYLCGNDDALSHIHSLVILDGDIVEEKNLSRQAFIEEDIGQSKAGVMASILNESFSLNWQGYDKYLLHASELTELTDQTNCIPVIVGCVDNHACRMVCEEFFTNSQECIYFDSANEFSSGEVVFAVKAGKKASPLRSDLFPEIKKGDLRNVEEMSCTELNAVAPQHIAANMEAGLHLLSAMTTLLEEGTAIAGMTVFDVKRMDSQFYPADKLSVRSAA